MKFAIAAVVVLAVAMGVESSNIYGGLGLGYSNLGLVNGAGLGYNSLGHGLGHGLGYNSIGLGAVPYGIGIHGQQLVQQPAWVGVPAAVNIHSTGYGPVAYNVASHIPAAVAVAPHAVAAPLAGHGATYVAKNRGAVHTAPLPGHVHSAASINVAPAPGTL